MLLFIFENFILYKFIFSISPHLISKAFLPCRKAAFFSKLWLIDNHLIKWQRILDCVVLITKS